MSFKGVQPNLDSNTRIAKVEINMELLTNLRQAFTTLLQKSSNDPDAQEQRTRFVKVVNKLKTGINSFSLNDMYDVNLALNERIVELEKNDPNNIDLDFMKEKLKDFRAIQQLLK